MKSIQVNVSGIEFIDSNIWLYALATGQDVRKEQIARKSINSKQIAVSAQVVNEVCLNLRKKHSFNEIALQKLIRSFYRKHLVVEINKNVLLKASSLRTNYSFSFWDSLIVAAALAANATVLYSEDMHDGLIIENKLKIVNPF